jgi:hypothetical protein
MLRLRNTRHNNHNESFMRQSDFFFSIFFRSAKSLYYVIFAFKCSKAELSLDSSHGNIKLIMKVVVKIKYKSN